MNKHPIVIDTDPGVDDALAIVIALFSDELDVRLISTVIDNIGLDKVTYNALRLLKYFGREDVPVAVGADQLLIRELEDISSVHGKSDMEGSDFEEPMQQPLKENAIDVMRNVIMNSSEPVTLVLIAPLTNIALLLKTYPEMERNTHEIVLMGDSASRGNKDVMVELNIALGSETTHMVSHSDVKLTTVGLDAELKALVLPEDSEEIRTTNKTGEMAYCLFKKHHRGSFRTGLKMYNTTATAYLLKPELSEAVETYLDAGLHGTVTAGCTPVDPKGYLGEEPSATICLDIDGNTFRTWFKKTIVKHRQSV